MNKEEIRELFLEPEFVNQFRENIVTPAIAEALNLKMEEMNSRVDGLKKELSAVTQKLGAAERKIQQLEAYSRRNNLTITGVPETDGENTDQIVLDVAKSAGVMLSPDDIDVSHRVGRSGTTNNNKPRSLIVKFLSHNVREKLFSARKEKSASRVHAHPLLTTETLRNIYISENLTPENQKLLFVCRKLKAKSQVWAAYSTNGRVKVRLGQAQPPILIECITDIEQLVGETAVREILDEPRFVPGSDGIAAVTPTNPSGSGRGSVPPADGRRPEKHVKASQPKKGHQAPHRPALRAPRDSR